MVNSSLDSLEMLLVLLAERHVAISWKTVVMVVVVMVVMVMASLVRIHLVLISVTESGRKVTEDKSVRRCLRGGRREWVHGFRRCGSEI
jgi:uncharacterized protein HemY